MAVTKNVLKVKFDCIENWEDVVYGWSLTYTNSTKIFGVYPWIQACGRPSPIIWTVVSNLRNVK